jgi:hypothetical protein
MEAVLDRTIKAIMEAVLDRTTAKAIMEVLDKDSNLTTIAEDETAQTTETTEAATTETIDVIASNNKFATLVVKLDAFHVREVATVSFFNDHSIRLNLLATVLC